MASSGGDGVNSNEAPPATIFSAGAPHLKMVSPADGTSLKDGNLLARLRVFLMGEPLLTQISWGRGQHLTASLMVQCEACLNQSQRLFAGSATCGLCGEESSMGILRSENAHFNAGEARRVIWFPGATLEAMLEQILQAGGVDVLGSSLASLDLADSLERYFSCTFDLVAEPYPDRREFKQGWSAGPVVALRKDLAMLSTKFATLGNSTGNSRSA